MREILFRGKCKDTDKWFTGQYIHLHKATYCFKGDYESDKDNDIHQIVFEKMTDWGLPNQHLRVNVIPETIGQYTGMTKFVMTDKSVNGKLFEGDIVEVWGWRRPKCDNPRSRYDGDFKVRAVIEFKFGEWRLNYDNGYNHSLEKLQGKESDDRVVDGNYRLYRFGYHGIPEHEDWRREHNSHYKWDDIVKIGTVYDKPELLEESK